MLLAAAPSGAVISEVVLQTAAEPASVVVEQAGANEVALEPLVDTSPPAIVARLVADTGFSSTDGLTNNPATMGSVQDPSGISSFRAGFDAAPDAAFVSVLADLGGNGVFSFSSSRLSQINGGPLADGSHTLHFRATDSVGNAGFFDLSFTLDTVRPDAPTLDLLASSDSGVSGNDNITNDLTPTFAFTADPTAQILLFHDFMLVTTLAPGTKTATIDAPGAGAFSYNAFAKDAAGNFSDSSVPLMVTFDPTAPEWPGFELATASLIGPTAVARVVVTPADVPAPISVERTLRSTATVSGTAGTLFDVNVGVTLSHASLLDLSAALISPAGTRVELFATLPGDGLTGTVFDDSAPTAMTFGSSPYTGRFLPAGSLAALNGEDPNGLWTLEVTDEAQLGQGTLTSWSLVLRTSTGLPSIAGSATVTLAGWTDPSVTVRLQETGVVTTSGLDGSFTFAGVAVPTSDSRWTISAMDRAGNQSSFVRDIIFGQGQAFLHGVAYHDRDAGGVRNPGEPGLAGWTIYLDLNRNQTLDVGEPSTLTDATGSYSFSVEPGAYAIAEILQSGWERTAPPGGHFDITVVEGDVRNGLDFGLLQLGQISGLVFHDLNANAVKENGESGLTGRTVFLDDNGNGLLDPGEINVLTDALGQYRLEARPGAYTLREVVPSGWRQTLPTTGGYAVTLIGGQAVTDRNFGEVQLGSLAGVKFEDVNGNGTRDAGEPGLAGWTVYLDSNGNGTLDPGERSTVTDATGAYLFTDLLPGPYRVAEQLQSGWVQTFPRLQTPNPASTDESAPLILPDEVGTADAALSTETAGQADVLTRLDRLSADPRFANLDGQGMTVAIIDTGIDVDHPFFGLDQNGDGVDDRIIAQMDFANQDTDASDHNGHGSNVASIIASQDAVYTGVAPDVNIVALKVFEDSGAGSFTYLEQALQWVIANAATYGIDVVNMSLGDGGNWTDAVGRYGIGDELATIADMGIIEVAAAGNGFFSVGSAQGLAYPAADPNVIATGAVWSADFGGPFTFGSGAKDFTTGPDRIASFSQRHETLLDLFAPGARLTGANQNGGTITLQGTSQASAYLSGIAVLSQQLAEAEVGRRLTPSEFVTLARTTGDLIIDGDDENDNVVNTGLTFPRVNMQALADAILSVTGPGPGSGNGGGNGQPSAAPLAAHAVTLQAGQQLANLDFGNFRLGEIRGVVFHDANVDGQRDPGEATLSGWTIYLDGNRNGIKDPGERSTTTDDAGAYRLADLGPGTYVVQEEAPARWGRTANAAGSPEFAMTSGASVITDFGNVRITLDVDGDGVVTAFGDGRLIARYLAGVSDVQLTAGAVVGPDAVRSGAAAIRTYLNLAQGLAPSMLDADGNGTIQSVTDGKLLVRYLAGLPDSQLMAGEVIGLNATLTTPDAIRDFLGTFMPEAGHQAPAAVLVQASGSSVEASSGSTGETTGQSAREPVGPTHPSDIPNLSGQGSALSLSAPTVFPLAPGLSMSADDSADDRQERPLIAPPRPWLQDFVGACSIVVEDPNRDLLVTV